MIDSMRSTGKWRPILAVGLTDRILWFRAQRLGYQACCGDGLFHEVVVAGAKLLPLVVRPHESLDKTHAGKILLDHRVQPVQAPLQLLHTAGASA